MIKNVVFMGTPDFAVGTLQALIDAGRYNVQAVFSQPDKPKGRGKAMQMPPVKETALAAGIPVYQPVKIREAQWLEKLKELNPDVVVVVAFGQIIPKEILELPRYGCINVHASLLPMYRGAAPIQWAVINGDKESGVT
ncbi:MAG: methionyl-tRNA formyltransferase, partial [Lachnospiraceae bacterium]|nr:methionyl-tRNA formyltransferase [Lachnospiraceae bacterium]